MDMTKDLIVSASLLPISIIIVGIGDEDFELMIELDGDEKVLRNSSGVPTARDIVQFVKFKDYQYSDITTLSEEVLREIPEQVVSYFSINKIKL